MLRTCARTAEKKITLASTLQPARVSDSPRIVPSAAVPSCFRFGWNEATIRSSRRPSETISFSLGHLHRSIRRVQVIVAHKACRLALPVDHRGLSLIVARA